MSGPSPKVRDLVKERDAGCCAWCARYCIEGVYSLQHRRARKMGGTSRPETNLPANLIVMCGTGTTGCHGRAEHAPELAKHYGHSILDAQTPTEEPVWLARHGWVLLDNFGNLEPCEDPRPEHTEMLERISRVLMEQP